MKEKILNNILDKINKRFGLNGHVKENGIWLEAESKNLIELCSYVKETFDHLSMISVTDFIHKKQFEIVYFLWSYNDKIALIIKTQIPRKKAVIKSVSNLWNEAQIHERELHEMFGIVFKGNPDLSELFLEGWKNKPPFRKDFDWREYVRKKYYKNKTRGYFEVNK